MMNIKIAVSIAVIILCVGILVYFGMSKSRQKYISALGKCLLELPRRNNRRAILVIVFSVVIVVIICFIRMSFLMFVLFNACAVLAVYISMKENVLFANSGVYEKGFITDGRLIKKDDVMAFPTLAYEKEEGTAIAPNVLKMVLKSSGETFIGFDDEECRNKAVEILKHWV